MSIANHSVVSRILAQVLQEPTPRELGAPERFEGVDQRLELRRTRCLHRSPFATPFHFWGHGLLGFLGELGRPELFEAMATHGLCRGVEGEAVGHALRALVGRLDGAPAASPDGGFRSGYCMIEQEEMVSWLGAREAEWVAAFWVRPSWLACAQPFDPRALEEGEPDEGADPGREWAGRPIPALRSCG